MITTVYLLRGYQIKNTERKQIEYSTILTHMTVQKSKVVQ